MFAFWDSTQQLIGRRIFFFHEMHTHSIFFKVLGAGWPEVPLISTINFDFLFVVLEGFFWFLFLSF